MTTTLQVMLSVWSCAAPQGANPDSLGGDSTDSGRSAPDSDTRDDTGHSGTTDDSGSCAPLTWYRDGDGDGYGDPGQEVADCVQPKGYVAEGSDCDDTHAYAYTGASERWTDGVDDDCNGTMSSESIDSLPLWQAHGVHGDAELGISLASGDFNGDGTDDLVVGGTLGELEGTLRGGTVLIFDGPLSSGAPVSEDTANAALYGTSRDLYSIACSTGDLDGDGFDDLVVGNPLAGGNYAGAAYVVRGPIDGVVDRTAGTQSFTGSSGGETLGLCAGPGDVDGDDFSDVVLGASESNGGVWDGYGSVYLLRGPAAQSSVEDADQILRGGVEDEAIGNHLAALGDLNGDGMQDYGVSNSGHAGTSPDGTAVYVVTDYALGEMHPRDVGTTVRYDLGGSVSSVFASKIDDVNGDGYCDVAFAPDRDSRAMSIVEGPFGLDSTTLDLSTAAVITLQSSAGGPNRWLSFAAALGDWNGDAQGVLAVADPAYATDETIATYDCTTAGACYQGAVYLLAEPIEPGVHDLAAEADRIEATYLKGSMGGGSQGPALSAGADLDGDFFPDLAFGAWYANTDVDEHEGSAYVLFGGGSP